MRYVVTSSRKPCSCEYISPDVEHSNQVDAGRGDLIKGPNDDDQKNEKKRAAQIGDPFNTHFLCRYADRSMLFYGYDVEKMSTSFHV